jgi:hypothetical protein
MAGDVRVNADGSITIGVIPQGSPSPVAESPRITEDVKASAIDVEPIPVKAETKKPVRKTSKK